MKHQTIYKKLGISYTYYTKLRNKYRFFSYITDVLTLNYVLHLDDSLCEDLIEDLREIIACKWVLRGLDMALFGGLVCFKPSILGYLQGINKLVTPYQSHKWQYPNTNNNGDTSVINI